MLEWTGYFICKTCGVVFGHNKAHPIRRCAFSGCNPGHFTDYTQRFYDFNFFVRPIMRERFWRRQVNPWMKLQQTTNERGKS